VSPRRAAVALLAAATGLGSVSVLVKLAYQAGARPDTLLAARLAVASAALTAAAAILRPPAEVEARHLRLAGAGGAAFAGAGLLEFQALAGAPAAPVVLLVFVAPVWVALASWAIWRETTGRSTAARIGLVLAGTALLVGGSGSQRVRLSAAALALGASVCSAAFFLSLSRLARELGPRLAACLVSTPAGAVAILAPGAALTELASAPRAIPALAIGALTAAALLLLGAGLSGTSAVAGATIAGAEPVVAALLAWVVLGETLGPPQLLGGLVVLAGVLQLARLPSAAPLVEPHRGDQDRAHHDVLPEPLDTGDQEAIREHHRDQDADDGAGDRPHSAGQARPADDHRRQSGDQLGGVPGAHAGDRKSGQLE
jgi:drug/metabolite transporter (DMT)-like permease